MVELDTHPLVFLIEGIRVHELVLHAFLMRLPELLNRVSVRTYLLGHIVVDHVDIRVCFAVRLVQLLALVRPGREETSIFS